MMQRNHSIYLFYFCLSAFFFTTGACSQSNDSLSPQQQLVSLLTKALKGKDTGAIMENIDRTYQDDLGGPGRLEDDLRRIFSVYGKLRFKIREKSKIDEDTFRIAYTIQGRGLFFSGQSIAHFKITPMGPLFVSGVFTEMRAVLEILRQRRLALERNSVDMLDSLISMDYKPKKGTRQEFISHLHEVLSSQGRVGIVVQDVKISIDKSRAKVVQSLLKLEIEDEATTREKRILEHIVLRKEGTRWRILQGIG